MPLGKFLMHLDSAVVSSGPASVVARYVLWMNECFGVFIASLQSLRWGRSLPWSVECTHNCPSCCLFYETPCFIDKSPEEMQVSKQGQQLQQIEDASVPNWKHFVFDNFARCVIIYSCNRRSPGNHCRLG